MATLKQATDLIDQFIGDLDDIIKAGEPLQFSRADLVGNDLDLMVSDLREVLSDEDAREADRYFRLKVVG